MNASACSRCSRTPPTSAPQHATALFRKKGAALEEVLALATGSDDSGLQVASALTCTDPTGYADARRDRGGGDRVARRGAGRRRHHRQPRGEHQPARRPAAGCPALPRPCRRQLSARYAGKAASTAEWAARTRDTVANSEEALGGIPRCGNRTHAGQFGGRQSDRSVSTPSMRWPVWSCRRRRLQRGRRSAASGARTGRQRRWLPIWSRHWSRSPMRPRRCVPRPAMP